MKKTIALFLALIITIQTFTAVCPPSFIPEDTTAYKELVFVIKYSEGYSDEEYKCIAGVKTIGWGITRGEVAAFNKTFDTNYRFEDLDNLKDNNEFLSLIIQWRYDTINEMYPGLDQRTAYALTSFTFNCGTGVLKKPSIRFGIWFAQAGYKRPLSEAMSKYVYAGKRKVNGLINRRKLESRLLFRQISPAELQKMESAILKATA